MKEQSPAVELRKHKMNLKHVVPGTRKTLKDYQSHRPKAHRYPHERAPAAKLGKIKMA